MVLQVWPLEFPLHRDSCTAPIMLQLWSSWNAWEAKLVSLSFLLRYVICFTVDELLTVRPTALESQEDLVSHAEVPEPHIRSPIPIAPEP